MAYQNLALQNLAGRINATYNDNNMNRAEVPPANDNPVVMLTGAAKQGFKNQPFVASRMQEVVREFHERSEICKTLQGALDANPDANISIMRVGGKPAHVSIERQIISESLETEALIRISPMLVQPADSANDIVDGLSLYKLILLPFKDGNSYRQRVIIVNTETSAFLYDSERILTQDGDAAFDVEINLPMGELLYTKSAHSSNFADGEKMTSAANVTALAGVVGLDIPDVNGANLSTLDNIAKANIQFLDLSGADNVADLGATVSIEKIDAEDGEGMNYCERYAANEDAYQALEFEDISFLSCVGCDGDIQPVDVDSLDTYEAGNWASKNLGYLWKYEFNGRPYMYFFGRSTPFSASNIPASVSVGGVTFTFNSTRHQVVGDLLNLVEFTFTHVPGKNSDATATVDTFINKKGKVDCFIEVSAAETSAITIKTPFCDIGIPAAASNSLFDNTNDSTDPVKLKLVASELNGATTVATTLMQTPTYNHNPFVLSHFDLTGEVVPEAVVERLFTIEQVIDSTTKLQLGDAATSQVTLKASNDEVREVSFLHQSAQAAYEASTNYNQVLSVVPMSEPKPGRNGISIWAGQSGVYQLDSNGILKITTNGSGVLGNKLLAGSTSYRDAEAFGGLMLTEGDKLPNEKPYGIDDQEEALDAMGNPIDLGKHIVVMGSNGFHRSSVGLYNRRRSITNPHFGSAAPLVASMISTLEPGSEPIGPIRGVIPGFSIQQNTPRSILNDLAALRIGMVDSSGVISSLYTAARSSSDYRKISSIMSANAIVRRLRNECLSIIGKAYTDAEIQSLSTRLDGMSRQLVALGFAQDLRTQLAASRAERINGVLRLSVTFVPPLSVEAITIDVTLEAPQSGI